MKIIFLTIGDETVASSRTRVYQYLPHLKKEGIEYIVLSCGTKTKTVFALLKLLLFANFHNIVFIQKVLLPDFYRRFLMLLNGNIVFDFDDAIYTYDAVSYGKEKKRIEKVYRPRMEGILQISKLVVIENEENATFVSAFCKNILKITGPIDTDRYISKKPGHLPSEKVTVGWIGSFSTTPYIEEMFSCLTRLVAIYPGITIKLIGATRFDTGGLPVIFTDWSLPTEVMELGDFDIGIMPMPDNKWTRGKGGYKLLQYMAMGIPAVASPVGINCNLIEDGANGFLASSEDEWVDKLAQLIADKDLRERMGRKGRGTVEEKYSFYHYTPVLILELKKVLQIQ